jgi:hypothetical protein
MDPRRPRFCEADHTIALKLHDQATRRLPPASPVKLAQDIDGGGLITAFA